VSSSFLTSSTSNSNSPSPGSLHASSESQSPPELLHLQVDELLQEVVVKMIEGAGLSEMLLTYPNSTGSGYAVSSNTRNEGMRSVRPLGIQGREDNVREQC
jgi:hypothetical protein